MKFQIISLSIDICVCVCVMYTILTNPAHDFQHTFLRHTDILQPASQIYRLSQQQKSRVKILSRIYNTQKVSITDCTEECVYLLAEMVTTRSCSNLYIEVVVKKIPITKNDCIIIIVHPPHTCKQTDDQHMKRGKFWYIQLRKKDVKWYR